MSPVWQRRAQSAEGDDAEPHRPMKQSDRSAESADTRCGRRDIPKVADRSRSNPQCDIARAGRMRIFELRAGMPVHAPGDHSIAEGSVNLGPGDMSLLLGSFASAIGGLWAAVTRRRSGRLLALNVMFAGCFGYFGTLPPGASVCLTASISSITRPT
jgi:hypothetical protein